MDYQKFVNQEVENIDGECGVVISFNDTHIVIKYPNVEKTYNPNIAFTNKYLSFVNDDLNLLINEDLEAKANIKKQEDEINAKKAKELLELKIKVKNLVKKLSRKNQILQDLFGSDFLYPPYVEFLRTFARYIEKEASTALYDYYYNYERYVS